MRRSGEVRLIKVDSGENNDYQPKMNRATPKSGHNRQKRPMACFLYPISCTKTLFSRKGRAASYAYFQSLFYNRLVFMQEGFYAHIHYIARHQTFFNNSKTRSTTFRYMYDLIVHASVLVKSCIMIKPNFENPQLLSYMP